jgi:hypothetical protein
MESVLDRIIASTERISDENLLQVPNVTGEANLIRRKIISAVSTWVLDPTKPVSTFREPRVLGLEFGGSGDAQLLVTDAALHLKGHGKNFVDKYIVRRGFEAVQKPDPAIWQNDQLVWASGDEAYLNLTTGESKTHAYSPEHSQIGVAPIFKMPMATVLKQKALRY